MSKHTPGPWHGRKDGKYAMDCPWSIDHEDGNDSSCVPVTSSSGRTVAVIVNDDSKRPMDFHEEEMHANARLIAAAPELLEALELALPSLGFEEADKARDAIAKAKSPT